MTINPFEEGNGRLSRLLSSLLLQKTGYSFISYYSFESIIEESRKTYLYSLKRTQQSFSEEVDYSSWINYFIKTMLKVCTKLEAKIENITRVTEFVNIQLEEAGCNGKAQRMIDVAIDAASIKYPS